MYNVLLQTIKPGFYLKVKSVQLNIFNQQNYKNKLQEEQD